MLNIYLDYYNIQMKMYKVRNRIEIKLKNTKELKILYHASFLLIKPTLPQAADDLKIALG